MELVDRSGEWELLRDAYAGCGEGRGQLVLVSGRFASGKTELLHAFGDFVVDSGALLLSATGARAEGALQRGVLGQLFHSDTLPPSVIARAASLILPAADPGQFGSPAMRPSDARVAQELCTIVSGLAKDQPVVMLVDDVQYADDASLQALLYLIRRMRTIPVLMVLTECEQPWSPRPWFHAELAGCPHREITLRPLSAQGVADLVELKLGAGRENLAEGLHAVSGGVPLLVKALIEDQAHGEGDPFVGAAFGRAVLACLHRSDPSFLEVARGMAILGDEATPALVGRLIEMDGGSVEQHLDGMARSGQFSPAELSRPAVHAALLDSLSPADRVVMHRDAAELLYWHGATPVTVARHVLGADDATAPWAIRILRDAADQSLVDDDVDTAIRCLSLALRASEDDTERVLITAALARAEWRVNPLAASRRLAPLHHALEDGTLTGRDLVTFIRYLLWQGKLDDATAQLGTVMESLTQADAQIAAELGLAYQFVYGTAPGSMPQETTNNPWTRARVTLTSMVQHGGGEDLVNNALHVLASCALGDSTLEMLATALSVLIGADRVDDAAISCERLLCDAAKRNAPMWQAVLASIRAHISLRQGDPAQAEELAATALELMSPQNWGVLIGYPLSTLMLANTAMGRHERAAALAQQIVPEAMFKTIFGPRYLNARGHHYLATGRLLAAFSDFEECGALVGALGLDVPVISMWRGDLAEVQVLLGRPWTAKELVTAQLEFAGGVTGRVKGVSLRVLAATSDPKERPRLLYAALDLLQVSGDRLELARCLVDLAQAHHELGELELARSAALRASQEARSCHAAPLLDRLSRWSVDVAETPTAAPDEADDAVGSVLSAAELRVAALATLGHTNREIGRRLYITPSTVEQHLTKVYRKLNVGGRKDLPAGLSLHVASTPTG
ncbi:LuxR family transcriptional regulator [Kutzneria buriramensis]|uniref:Regulatory LuxR family protein n=1 Tax=Kutzneria buriramensis TaxID=1045776 RepID=A0A3E0I5T2_9PSEU|nr:LuxR family transcriptional regulator [Kutzneria buriramensis]REH53960.1 regulatory LuxR family protein [Kutzneria buriramensis]